MSLSCVPLRPFSYKKLFNFSSNLPLLISNLCFKFSLRIQQTIKQWQSPY